MCRALFWPWMHRSTYVRELQEVSERVLGGAVGGKPGESAQEARFALRKDLPLISVHLAKRKVIKDGRERVEWGAAGGREQAGRGATDPARDARRE